MLQHSMPELIKRLEALVVEESNPDHPLWPGHLERGSFLAENLKLTTPSKKGSRTLPAEDGQQGNGDVPGDEQLAQDEEEVGHDEDDEDGHIKDTTSGGDKAVRHWGKGSKGDEADGIKSATSYPYALPTNEINSQVVRIVRK